MIASGLGLLATVDGQAPADAIRALCRGGAGGQLLSRVVSTAG